MSIQDVEQIKEVVEELLQKMTLTDFHVEIIASLQDKDGRDVVDIGVTLQEPQVLIGQGGQTLFELQRLVRIIVNKKLKKDFYITLDINGYKSKKIEYLKNTAITLADTVALTKEKKILPPMPAYERRIIHAQLAERQDVITESQGEGLNRCIVISPR